MAVKPETNILILYDNINKKYYTMDSTQLAQ